MIWRKCIELCRQWRARLTPERHDLARRGDVYLARWVLWGKRFGPGGKVFLHKFHRGDQDDALHDHPWPFWSLILWGGYWEETLTGVADPGTGVAVRQRRWHEPGSLLRRPAEWLHRVVLPPGRHCWTLVWTGPKERSWGFLCRDGRRVPWRAFVGRVEDNLDGCG